MHFLMLILSIFRLLRDVPHRIRNWLKRRSLKNTNTILLGDKSDSQSMPYAQYVRDVINRKKPFEKFRQNYDYREILEHVPYGLGLQYYNQIEKNKHNWIRDSIAIKALNQIGQPRKYYYENIGFFSPTTLRYIHIAQQIGRNFNGFIGEKVVEIGVGFGGQMTILLEQFEIESYTLIDLEDVLKLTKFYLDSSLQISPKIQFISDIRGHDANFDLVVSNFAFSEFSRSLQEYYLENVLVRSKRGFMLMNSGKSNYTGRSEGKLTLGEIKTYLPNLQIIDEIPQSGPDNYLILWGNEK